jgi:lysozyme family protein
MSNFDAIIEKVLLSEGGYVNHPDDPGGETNFGITKRVAEAHGYAGNMIDMTRERAKDIYRLSYWKRIQGDKFTYDVAMNLMDAAVNHGIGNAVRMLQRALDIADDGVIGKVTLDHANASDNLYLVTRFNIERLRFYAKLKAFDTFGRGWTRRVADMLEAFGGE